MLVPHCPHHVVQRGHSRQDVFDGPSGRRSYLQDLYEKKAELNVQVHAYCLMSNHVHLLLTPGGDASAISRLMKELARRATRRWNIRMDRSGSLWESRFKSSVVQSDAYLLACCRYIELNPVRAGIVQKAEQFRWSSYRGRMGLSSDPILDLHPIYSALGGSSALRQQVYRQYMESEVAEDEMSMIRSGSRASLPTGEPIFVEELERSIERKVMPARKGRPAKCLTP